MKKNDNIFWIGYSDLMTSLFFIMLVLFVVTIAYLQHKINVSDEQKRKIDEITAAVKQLPETYFEYQPMYKRFKLKKQIQFDMGDDKIKNEYNDYLTNVGKSINTLIDTLSKGKYKDLDIKYLIVIEGMASKSKDNYQYNFELSYKRALALYRHWKVQINGIIFNPAYCEIQIAGSGTDGIREYSGAQEYMNQQFLIQIVPKMGKISDK